jgi:type II secretory pathway component PulF
MGFITTPARLKQQGSFYHQLASMTRAGVTIVQSVEVLHRSPPNAALGRMAAHIAELILRGSTFTEAMRSLGRQLPEFDVSLLEAGETSGRLAECFQLLGDFYTERGRLAAQVVSALLYPAFLFHFALLIFPVSLLTELVWQGNATNFLVNKITILLPTYALILFFLWSMQAQRGRAWRNFMEGLLNAIPLVSKTRRDLALARLCAALEALINAGVTIIEAWDIAARASGSHAIQRAVAEAKPRLLEGETPADAIEDQRIYPDLFKGSYRTGEISGQLDDALRRLYRHYMESATEGLERITTWAPKILYLGVALAIAYQIIQFWSGYFDQINKVMQ